MDSTFSCNKSVTQSFESEKSKYLFYVRGVTRMMITVLRADSLFVVCEFIIDLFLHENIKKIKVWVARKRSTVYDS